MYCMTLAYAVILPIVPLNTTLLDHMYGTPLNVFTGETVKNFGDWCLLILAAIVKNLDTNRAYTEVSASNHLILRGVSKSTFFQCVNYLQNLGLITRIKKKIGRYYTMESQILLSDASIVTGELRKRL